MVDQDDSHVYQPGLLFVPFGLATPEDIVRSRPRQLHGGIGYDRSAVDRVDIDNDRRTWPTARPSPTTCWWSRPARDCCPRRPTV